MQKVKKILNLITLVVLVSSNVFTPLSYVTADFEEVVEATAETTPDSGSSEQAVSPDDSEGGGDSFNENSLEGDSDEGDLDDGESDGNDLDGSSSEEGEETQEENQDKENRSDDEAEGDDETAEVGQEDETQEDEKHEADKTSDLGNDEKVVDDDSTGNTTQENVTQEDKQEAPLDDEKQDTIDETSDTDQSKIDNEDGEDLPAEESVEEEKTEENEEQVEEKSEIEKAWDTLNESLIENSESFSGVSISVESPANTFPNGTQLRIEPVIGADLDDIKQQILGNNNKALEDSIVAFNIKFVYELEDGSEVKVQPRGNTVQVKLDYSESDEFKNIDSKQLKIYHFEDKSENVSIPEEQEVIAVKSMKKTKSRINSVSTINEITSLNINKENKTVSLSADSFSIYAIIKTNILESVRVNYNAGDGKFAGNTSVVTVTYTLNNGDYVADKATQQPNRDNYMFKGWYTSNDCSTRWNGIVDDTDNSEITVYACYLPFSDDTLSFGRFSFTMMDRNLGAESTSDYGYYYQWGNNYGFVYGGLTPAISTDLVPTNTYNGQPRGPSNSYSSSNFISRSSSPFRWDSADNRNLWGGTSTDQEDWQGPCPDGYHVPNSAEWKAVYDSYTKSGYLAKDFGITLGLPLAGYRDAISSAGDTQGQGYDGWYWASNAYNSDSAYALTVSDSSANATNNKYRSYANSVRCFKNTDTVTISFESNEGSEVDDMTFNRYEARTVLTKPIPTKEGISFAGWYYDSELTEEFVWANNTYVTEDTTLYAKWGCEPGYVLNNSNECVLRQVTVNYMLGEELYKTMTYARNISGHYLPTTTSFFTPQKEGNWMFDQWYLDPEFTTLWKYPMDNDGLGETVTVYGKFLPFEEKTISVNGVSFTIMDRNLGAKSASLGYDDSTAENIGYYYQYGNNYGFPNSGVWDNITSEQVKNPLTASASAWSRTNPYSNGLFVTKSPWNTNSLTNLWGGYSANQNPDSYKIGPCPEGYHVPEYLEYEAAYNTIKTNKSQFPECSGLSDGYCVSKVLGLPFGGYREGATSNVAGDGVGYYGMSSYYSYSQGYREKIENTSPSNASSNRASWGGIAAFNLRCFKDTDRYVLTFDSKGGSTPATQYIWWWKPYSTASSTRYGSVFSGWYYDEEYQNKFTGTLTENTTVYARWECEQGFVMDDEGNCITDQHVYVTFEANPSTFPGGKFSDGTTKKTLEYKGMPAGYFAAVDEEIQIPDLDGNYMFEGWYTDTNYTSASRWTGLSVNSPSEMTLYARYLPFNEKTLTWDGVSFTIMDRNLGATDFVSGYSYSTANSPAAVRGNYFQWGNNFGFPTEGTYTNTAYNTFVERVSDKARGPGNYYYNGTFIRRPESPYYRNSGSIAYENLWGGSAAANSDVSRQGPCPDGYHVPYTTEWLATKNLFDKWALTEAGSSYCSSIHETNTAIQYCMPAALGLPFAGYRNSSSSSIGGAGTYGLYWSSTAYSADRAYYLGFGSSSLNPQSGYSRAYGLSVRCFKDSPSLTLTFDSNGGSSVSSQTNFRWWQARSSKPTNPTRANSTFVGWFADEELTQDFTFSTTTYVSENTTLYAKWSCKEGYSPSADGQRCEGSSVVTFNATANGGDTSRPVVGFKSGDTVNLSDYWATKAGWTFVGWNTNQTAKEAMDNFVIGNDGVRVYAIFKKDLTATFKRNGNDSQTSNGNTTTDDIEKTCTIRNKETSCNITTPTITSSVTKKILGYSDSATNHVGTYGVNSNISISSDITLYAQTMTDPLDRLITFNPNGNTSFTYNGDTQTSATDYVLCTIDAVYNGDTQSNQCTKTITFPDITPNGEKTVLGWSTGANLVDNLISTGASQELVATKNLVYYAQSQSDGKTFTVTFYGNGASVSGATSRQESCTIEGVYNGGVPATECDVNVPSITREGFTILGFDSDENAQTATYSTSVDKITVSSDRSLYAISNKPVSVKFYKNGNDSQIKDGQSVADTSEFVSENCTIRNKATFCSVVTPQISSVNTPTVLGYSLAANNHEIAVNEKSSLSVSDDINYYAQTKKDGKVIYVSFYTNGNLGYTYDTVSYTEDSTHELCTINEVYNGQVQPSTCNISVTFPTISAPTNTPTVLGWSDSNSNHDVEYSNGQTATVIAGEDKHYFAQTTKEGRTLTGTFNKGKGIESVEYSTKGCSISAIFNGNDGNEQASSCLIEFPSFELKAGYENPIWQQAILGNQNANTATSLLITENTVFTLVASPTSYSINYNKQGGTLVNEKTSYTVEDDNFMLAIPSKRGYTFEGWTGSNGNTPQTSVTVEKGTYGNLSYTANWSLNNYNIEYHLDGGVVDGENPTEYTIETANYTLINPTREGYTFEGWTGSNGNIPSTSVTIRQGVTVGNLEYYANWTPIKYTITFVNEDGTELQSSQVDYDTTPVYSGETPTKEQDAQYTYEFDGWTPSISVVKGAQVYTATYTSTLRSFEVTVNSEDDNKGTVNSEVSGSHRYGTRITLIATPKVGYRFINWTKNGTEIGTEETIEVEITEASNITGHFSANDNTAYKVEHYKEKLDGTYELAKTDNETGTTDTTATATPKTSYEGFTYDPTIEGTKISGNISGSGDLVLKLFYKRNLYNITFYDEDGTTILKETESYKYGTSADDIAKPEDPSKLSDVQYTYTFAGWDPEVSEVTQSVSYIAKYSNSLNSYTIEFVNENGDVLQSTEVSYGALPSYSGATPTKAADVQYTYTFAGWDSEITEVTGNKRYTATYTSTINQYNVTFVDEDGITVLKAATAYDYGTLAADIVRPANPTKARTQQYTYTFAGWEPEVAAVSADVIYRATYNSTVNQYTITFYDEDGETVLDTQTVDYGTAATYGGSEPTKARTQQYTYTFSDWYTAKEGGAVDNLSNVTADRSVYARYSATVNKYTVSINVGEGLYGTVSNYSLEFDYGTLITIDNLNKKIRFGSAVEVVAKEMDDTEQYDYEFVNWTNNCGSEVVDNCTITANFSMELQTYEVATNTNDVNKGTVSGGGTKTYGERITLVAHPILGYRLEKWLKNGVVVTTGDNEVYTGLELEVEVTEALNVTGHFVARDDTEYTVRHWQQNVDNDEYTEVVGDATTEHGTTDGQTTAVATSYEGFVAQTIVQQTIAADGSTEVNVYYDRNIYTITWKNDNGTVLETDEGVRYGAIPSYDGATPTKAADAQYTYTFNGTWSPEIEAVVGDATYTATYSSVVNKYDITVSSNDENKGTVIGGGTQEYGKSMKVIATAKQGYKFNKWVEGGETVSTEAEYEFTVGGNRDLVAEFGARDDTTYTVNYMSQNLDLNDDRYQILEESLPLSGITDTLTVIPVRTYEGLTLVGDFDDYQTQIAPDGSTVVEVLYNRNIYTITYNPDNGDEPVSFQAKYGKSLQKPADPEKQGYTFAGWVPEFPSSMPLNGTSVVAQWTPNTDTAYRVEYYYQLADGNYPTIATSGDDRIGTTDDTVSVSNADKISSVQGYAFAEGYSENVLNGTVAADGSLILKVYFKKQFTVTYKPGDRGTFADDVHDGLDYNSDTPSFAGSLDHQDGYIFKSWDSTIATKVTANAVYTALWAEDFNNDGIDDATQDRYIVTYTDGVDGEEIFVNQTTSNLLSGFNTPAFSGTPTREHYLFAGWNPTVADKVTGNAVYTATWNEDFNDNGIDDATEPHFTVRFEAGAHGSLVGTLIYNNVLSGLTLNDLGYIEPTKQPAENYMFSGWNIEVNPSSKITGNVTYTAIWGEDKNHDGQNDEFEDKYTVTINYVYSRGGEAATKYEITNQLSGFTYNVDSPSVIYYHADKTNVSGTITGNVNVTVTYTPDNDTNGNGVADELETEYKVTVNYVYSRGGEASPSVSGMYLSGISFSFTSPDITYYHADQSVISGKGKEEAQTFTVTYTPDNDENHDGVADEEEDKYTVTINYVYSRGGEAATKYEITNQLSGFTYNVDSPSVIYYHADKTNVSGTITGNVEVTVTYTPDNDTNGNGVADELETEYKVTVNYVYVDGNTAAESVSGMYLSGISYSFESPVINHYTADVLVVSGVTVGTETFTVTYVANKYEIKFVNYDGSVLQTSQVEYGTLPVYEGEVPTKDATDGYIYTFAGWTPEISEVAGDTTYTATFTENRRGYSGGGGRNSTDEDDQSHNSADDEQQNDTGNTQPVVTEDNKSKYSEEVIDAYTWAYGYDITTMDTLDKAMPDNYVIRGHLAKMAVNYAVNVLGREIPSEIPDKCSWGDDESVWESAEIKDYAEKACALGVMGIKVKNFDPNKIVSRAEFGTVLSRLLWGETYDVENPTDKNLYYVKHLKALKDNNIMMDIDNPLRRNELRKWIWVMFRRVKDML